MKKEKTFNLIGLILGIAIIIVGIYFLAAPAASYMVSYCAFGADFYTEQYAATRAAANNLHELGGMLAQYAGFAFIFAGAIVSLEYGKKYLCSNVEPEKTEKDELPEL